MRVYITIENAVKRYEDYKKFNPATLLSFQEFMEFDHVYVYNIFYNYKIW
jgi:hypothetical protein